MTTKLLLFVNLEPPPHLKSTLVSLPVSPISFPGFISGNISLSVKKEEEKKRQLKEEKE